MAEQPGSVGMPSLLTLRLFGSMEAVCGERVLPIRARKEVWLLCLLALRPGQAVEREWLAGVLWPDCKEQTALYNLRRSLSNLRDALGEQAARFHSPSARTLQFDLQGAEVDVLAFDAAIRRSDLPSLQQAVGLYRGPLLQDCQEEWVYTERVQREQAYLAALDTLAGDALARQEWNEAAGYARRLIAQDALQEAAHRTLMTALAHSGSHAAAAQVYRDLRLRLREELNAEPDAATRTLFERIREEARRQATSPAPPPSPSPVAPSSPSSALPPLPRPITRLVGREEALQETLGLMRSGRLLTLTGMGGMGKTRLALEIAHALAEGFADGVAFVDLSDVNEASRVVQKVMGALNVREEVGVDLKSTLAAFLQPRQLLLILDNCEHLLDACARLINALLSVCPGLQVLATSRQSLGLPGETLWRVPSLSVPPVLPVTSLGKQSKQDRSEFLEYASVQLFVERVRQANPEFRLTPSNLPCIANICQHLDGIPLALELAAGRVKALSVEQIAARLKDRFKLLTGGNRAALPRQQTLRALIDWSYSLLEEEEKRLLGCLAVFSGGWTLEAAEAVCAEAEKWEAWEVVDLLSSLVDKSLVVMETPQGVVRYRMLETVRDYAQETQASPEDTLPLQRRHRDYFTEFAWATWHLPVSEGVQAVAREYGNMLAALDFAMTDAEAAQKAMRLAAGLQRFWEVQGPWADAAHYYRLASEHPGADRYSRAMVLTLLKRANIARLIGNLEEAETYFRETAALSQRLATPEIETDALLGLSTLRQMQGDYASARAFCEQAMALNDRHPYKQFVVYVLFKMATIQRTLGEYEDALRHCEAGILLGKEEKEERAVYEGKHILGTIYLAQGDYPSAQSCLCEALTLYQEIGSSGGEAGVRQDLGELAVQMGESDQARLYFTQSLQLNLRIGYQMGVLNNLESLLPLMPAPDKREKRALLLGWTLHFRERYRLQQRDQENQALREELLQQLGKEPLDMLCTRGAQLTLQEAAQIGLEA